MTPTTNGLAPLLTADELATQLGRNRRWVYRAVADHGLPAVAVGRSLFFYVADVSAWITANQVGTPPAKTNGATSSTPETEKAPSSASPAIATQRTAPRG